MRNICTDRLAEEALCKWEFVGASSFMQIWQQKREHSPQTKKIILLCFAKWDYLIETSGQMYCTDRIRNWGDEVIIKCALKIPSLWNKNNPTLRRMYALNFVKFVNPQNADHTEMLPIFTKLQGHPLLQVPIHQVWRPNARRWKLRDKRGNQMIAENNDGIFYAQQ